jgi:hypothetical protein
MLLFHGFGEESTEMARLAVSSTQDTLMQDGKPFFYLADTAWMAFSNLPFGDWPRYLAYRKRQGFTALQISILPVTHDTSMSPDNIDPFLKDSNGHWDFSAYNEVYFSKAETMVEMAVEQGFVPVLGVLWCNYVPDTWAAKRSPISSAMSLEAATAYARYAAERFKRFDPIFFISGDTAFDSPHEEAYYLNALQAVKAVCPEALITMHLSPRADLSRTFVDAVDFYMYQSGHGAKRQDQPYLLAEKFASYPVKRPVVNSEPPYEGHGRVGEQSRFNAFDIRKATWQSLLSGAKMGVTYGAHGIWMFHRRGMQFLNAQHSFEPYDWDQALLLDGAWDVGFARWLFESYNLFELDPAAIVLNEDKEIRAAATTDRSKVCVYSPYSFDVELDLDLTGYHCVQIDMATRRILTPLVESGAHSRIAMHSLNGDSLFVAIRD